MNMKEKFEAFAKPRGILEGINYDAQNDRYDWPETNIAYAAFKQESNFNSHEVEPEESGWYVVRREDGSLCLRGYGNGLWWIPLKDGWLSGLPTPFTWFGPVMPIDWDTPGVKVGNSNIEDDAHDCCGVCHHD